MRRAGFVQLISNSLDSAGRAHDHVSEFDDSKTLEWQRVLDGGHVKFSVAQAATP